MWGLFFGLKLAEDRGIRNLLVEMDFAVAVNCWEFMRNDTCALQYRERNMDLGVCFLDMAPSWIGASLVDDLLGVTRTRLVCSEQLLFYPTVHK
ncbi:unnamed protein product [Prunus armeniaca]